MASVAPANQVYLADLESPFCGLNIKATWDGLTDQEKLYAHWMARAAWGGSRIIMNQWSEFGEDIHDFLITLFSKPGKNEIADLKKLKEASKVSDEDWGYLINYASQALSNMVNYKNFGNSKFTPRCHRDIFEQVIEACENKDAAKALWAKIRHELYSLVPEGLNLIGKPSKGHRSNYYPDSHTITDAEVDAVQSLCNENGVSTINSRLKKHSSREFTLLIASASTSPHAKGADLISKDSNHPIKVNLKNGDFSKQLAKVNEALKEAAKNAANQNQRDMLEHYEKSFAEGDIEDHKQGSRHWVKDFGPVVESYIGFIEDYTDPYGARAEWEGFVAVVDKEQSKKYGKMVDQAEELIGVLPWGKEFEVEVFKRPDFTSLEIVAFCTGGIPVGINIPNYHDIRENHGFKNVSLGNILNARAAGEPSTFIHPDEVELFQEWSPKTFAMQVANHELLGHGTGKLLGVDEKGNFNFDKEKLINPLTGKPVESWYQYGQTWSTRGGAVSSSMEECRAEAVALFLASDKRILEIFGYKTKEDQEAVIYFTFLDMSRAGLRGIEFYEPTSKKHGQAHMQGRLAIFKWLYTHDLVKLEDKLDEEGKRVDVYLKVDKATVLEKGQEIMGKMLVELQVRKSIADPNVAEWYTELSRPLDEWLGGFRDLIISKKLPRKIFVQPNTFVEGGKVQLKEYDLTCEGCIQSWIERGI